MWTPRPFVRSLNGWQSHVRARSSSWAVATLAVGLLASGLGMYASDSWGVRPRITMPASDVRPAGQHQSFGKPHTEHLGERLGSPPPVSPLQVSPPQGAAGLEVVAGLEELAGWKLTRRPIERVRVGDRVVAQDPRTGETSLKEVTQVFRRRSDHLRRLCVEPAVAPDVRPRNATRPGTNGLGVERESRQWLETTNEHPFWVPHRGWVPAGQLVVGDYLRQSDGALAQVVEIDLQWASQGVPVFNIETADFHTYFVAADQRSAPLLVHNCNPESLGKLYHYTAADPEQILARGLRPGSSGKVFVTTNGTLSPLQAQLDLALPPNRGLPQHLVEIDVGTLRDLGIELPELQKAGRRFNMPGGGPEMGIPERIPPNAIRKVR